MRVMREEEDENVVRDRSRNRDSQQFIQFTVNGLVLVASLQPSDDG